MDELEYPTVRAFVSPWNEGVELLISSRSGLEEMKVVKGFILETIKDNSFIDIKPTLKIKRDEAQTLFNDLWNAGYRPADGTGNSGHVAALEKTIEYLINHVDKLLGLVAKSHNE